MPRYQITSPDGKHYEVDAPEGASMQDALEYAKANFHTATPEMTPLQRFGTGVKDPFVGIAQLAGHTILPTSTMESIDQYATERERGIEEARGPDAGTDWYRLAGNVASPINFVPVAGAVGRGAGLVGKGVQAATKLGNFGRGVATGAAAGAVGGATQPVTTADDYWAQKRRDIGYGTVGGGIIGAGTGALSSGVRALGERIARDWPESVNTQAVQAILRRLNQDAKAQGVKAKDVVNLVVDAQQAGKPMTLADAAGENTLALGGHLYRQPGGEMPKRLASGQVVRDKAGKVVNETFDSRNLIRNFLEERDKGAVSRLEKDIDRTLYGGASAFQSREMLMASRSGQATPFYTQMKTMPAQSPRLAQFYADPTIKKGLSLGMKMERVRALIEGRPFEEPNPQQPTLYVADIAKQGLDALIDNERNAITGRLSKQGVLFDQLRREFLKELDGVDPQGIYRQAREHWAGPSASLDAIKFGQSIFEPSWDAEELAHEFSKLSDSNKEFARLGVASALKVKLFSGGVRADESKLLLKNDLARMKLRPFFENPKDFDDFVESVAREQQMFETKFRTMGGSQTAERQMEDRSFSSGRMAAGAHFAHQMATGNWFSAVRTALEMWRDLGLKNNPRLNEKIAQMIFESEIPPTGQLQAWLKGSRAKRFALPQSVDPLLPIAKGVNQAGLGLSVGAGSALSGE